MILLLPRHLPRPCLPLALTDSSQPGKSPVESLAFSLALEHPLVRGEQGMSPICNDLTDAEDDDNFSPSSPVHLPRFKPRSLWLIFIGFSRTCGARSSFPRLPWSTFKSLSTTHTLSTRPLSRGYIQGLSRGLAGGFWRPSAISYRHRCPGSCTAPWSVFVNHCCRERRVPRLACWIKCFSFRCDEHLVTVRSILHVPVLLLRGWASPFPLPLAKRETEG